MTFFLNKSCARFSSASAFTWLALSLARAPLACAAAARNGRGVRRNQTGDRNKSQFVEWYGRYNTYAVSPLLNWSSKDIYQYMKQHDLPYHPLYEKGYPSIGCNPQSCTRAIQAGEDPRSGRWSGTGKVECGINLSSLDSSQL